MNGFLSQTNISPGAAEVPCSPPSLLQLLLRYWNFGIGFSLGFLCLHPPFTCQALLKSDLLRVSLLHFFHVLFSLWNWRSELDKGFQEWPDSVRRIGMITFPDLCSFSLVDVTQGAVNSLSGHVHCSKKSQTKTKFPTGITSYFLLSYKVPPGLPLEMQHFLLYKNNTIYLCKLPEGFYWKNLRI